MPGPIQAIQNNLPVYKTKGITLVIVSAEAKLPLELEREVVVLDFPLPSREEGDRSHFRIVSCER